MMKFHPRPYQSSGNDLNKAAALIQAAWHPHRRPDANFHIGDLYWRLREPAYEQTLWLWEDERGRLAAFAEWSAEDKTLEIQVHPEYADAGLDREIVEWAEREASYHAGFDLTSVTTFASEANVGFTAWLRDKGYQLQDKYTNSHCRQLDSPLAVPPLPEGYIVRSLNGEEEREARVQGHRTGWQSTKMTEATYERLMQMPGYRLDLDIVVEAPEQLFAATCNCWLDEQNGVGLFEPVSTHPDHRRKGLARAMLVYGMNRLYSLGATEALVGSVSHNPAATRLYESCGMQVVRRDFHYISYFQDTL